MRLSSSKSEQTVINVREKNLNETNINVDLLVSDIEDCSSENDHPLESQETNQIVENEENGQIKKRTSSKVVLFNEDAPLFKKRGVKNPRKFVRVPRTEEEKKVTTEYFKKHILLNRAPKKRRM